jgi:hypothetical protein
VGRAFSGAAIELALSSYPGFHVPAPPGEASPYGVFTSAFVDARQVPHVAVLPDGTRIDIAPAEHTQPLADVPAPALPAAPSGLTTRVPLSRVVGTRSGDKGADANLGVWIDSDEGWAWLAGYLSAARLQELLPETRECTVTRHALPNLRALNFVIGGLLGAGVASNARHDPQAKALGEWLGSRLVDVPQAVLGAQS